MMRILGRMFVVSVAVVIAAGRAASAQGDDVRQRFEKFSLATSLDREGLVPWHLKMSFQVHDLNGKPEEAGAIEEWWVSPQSRKLVISSPSYTVPHTGEGESIASHRREAYLVEALLSEVVHPVPDYKRFPDLNISEEKRTLGKTQLICYGVVPVSKNQAAKNDRPAGATALTFCAEPDSNILRVRLDAGQFTAVRTRVGTFQNTAVPLDETLSYAGKVAITGHVESLSTFDPKSIQIELPVASKSASTIPGGVLAGHKIKTETPVYPLVAKQSHLGGSVTMLAIISKEGKITNLEVLASPDKILSDAAMDAVKHWMYQPYLLNGQPTEVDTTITVNFNLNGG